VRVFVVAFLWICGTPSSAARVASTLEYTIVEEIPTGSVVGDLKRDSGLESEYGDDDLRRMRFHFRSAEPRRLFALDAQSGVITTSRRVDRDRMCPAPRSDECDVTVDVTVRPTNYFRLIRVVVHVADVNDNRPSFGVDHVTIHVMETAQPGTQFVLPSADDADSGDNGVKEYQLRHDGNDTVPFELVVTDQVRKLLVYYVRQGGYVFVVVCLVVCLLATLHKNFRTDLHEIFREGWQWAIEQMMKFRWRSRTGSPDGGTDIATLVRRAFACRGMHSSSVSSSIFDDSLNCICLIIFIYRYRQFVVQVLQSVGCVCVLA